MTGAGDTPHLREAGKVTLAPEGVWKAETRR